MFLSIDELNDIGFKTIGTNVKISNKTSIYNPSHISIGNNVRIDDFSILSAGEGDIIIGNNVHVACFCSLIGKSDIILGDYTGISSRVSIYSSTDDYSGEYLSNPTIPEKYKNVYNSPVYIENHVLIGSGCVVLPGVTIGLGSSIGALSLVTKNINRHELHAGIPAKFIKTLSINFLTQKKLYEYETEKTK